MSLNCERCNKPLQPQEEAVLARKVIIDDCGEYYSNVEDLAIYCLDCDGKKILPKSSRIISNKNIEKVLVLLSGMIDSIPYLDKNLEEGEEEIRKILEES